MVRLLIQNKQYLVNFSVECHRMFDLNEGCRNLVNELVLTWNLVSLALNPCAVSAFNPSAGRHHILAAIRSSVAPVRLARSAPGPAGRPILAYGLY